MTLYLGNKPIGLCKVVEKKVAKEKFGATIDSFLGDVDENGMYRAPTESIEINLAGVKTIQASAFKNKFYGTSIPVKIIANDVTILYNDAFTAIFNSASGSVEFEANSIEDIGNSSVRAFEYAFYQAKDVKVKFNKLKKISAANAFQGAFQYTQVDFDEVFPLLEEITGSAAFSYLVGSAGQTFTFSKIKKIIGGPATYNATFGHVYVQNTVWHFPSATEFTGYIWNAGSSYAGEIHFAAANQAAIEACDGYANKWGFAGATIFFDL